MGPVILARALEGRAPYAVKVHGSALEYTVRPQPRALPAVRARGHPRRAGVLVGSRHTAESLWEVLADEPSLPERTRLGPPGVDVHTFRPRRRGGAGLERLGEQLEPAAAAWGGEPGAADALRSLDPRRDRIVSYVGKLIVSKGVDLLLAAWPLVVGAGAGRAAGRGRASAPTARRSDRFVDALRARGPRRRCATSRRAGASSRAGPPGELRTCAPSSTRAGDDWLRRRARRPPSGSTSPAASSTTTCRTCCPPARPR